MKKILTSFLVAIIMAMATTAWSTPYQCYTSYAGQNCGAGNNVMLGLNCAPDTDAGDPTASSKASWDLYCDALTHGSGVNCLLTAFNAAWNAAYCNCDVGYAGATCTSCASGYTDFSGTCIKETALIYDADKDTLVTVEQTADDDTTRFWNGGVEYLDRTGSASGVLDSVTDKGAVVEDGYGYFLEAGDAGTDTTGGVGGNISFSAGDAKGAGNNDGGSIIFDVGVYTGTAEWGSLEFERNGTSFGFIGYDGSNGLILGSADAPPATAGGSVELNAASGGTGDTDGGDIILNAGDESGAGDEGKVDMRVDGTNFFHFSPNGVDGGGEIDAPDAAGSSAGNDIMINASYGVGPAGANNGGYINLGVGTPFGVANNGSVDIYLNSLGSYSWHTSIYPDDSDGTYIYNAATSGAGKDAFIIGPTTDWDEGYLFRVVDTLSVVAGSPVYDNRFGIINHGGIRVIQDNTTGSSAPQVLYLYGGTMDGIAATLISPEFWFDSGTKEWLEGNIAAQHNMYIDAPTYRIAGGGGTITEASTVYIKDDPIASTGATITNAFGIVNEGKTRFGDQIRIPDGTSTNGAVTFNSDQTWDMFLDPDVGGESEWSFTHGSNPSFAMSDDYIKADMLEAFIDDLKIQGHTPDSAGAEAIKIGNTFKLLYESDLLEFYNGPIVGFGVTGIDVSVTDSVESTISIVENVYTGVAPTQYVIEIDAGSPNPTFRWSDDNGATWEDSGIDLIAASVVGPYNLNNGVIVYVTNYQDNPMGTVYTVGDKWEFDFEASEKIGFMTAEGGFIEGVDASLVDFPEAFSIFSMDNTGVTDTASNIAIVAEAEADGTYNAYGVRGFARVTDNKFAVGIAGTATVQTGASDSGTAYGVVANATSSHSAGDNIGVFSTASGGDEDYSFYGLLGNLFNLEKVAAGSAANFADFAAAEAFFSTANTAQTSVDNIGVVGEAKAGGVIEGVGIHGIGQTLAGKDGVGVRGVALVDNTADNADAIGLKGLSTATHVGGRNAAVWGDASGGATNYSFYGTEGQIYNEDEVVIGSTFVAADWGSFFVGISEGEATQTLTGNEIGLVVEAVANSDKDTMAIVGSAKGDADTSAIGVAGFARPGLSTDTDSSIGVEGQAITAHSGGWNVGVLGNATGSDVINYSFYGQAGDIYNGGQQAFNPSGDTSLANDATMTPTKAIMRVVGSGGAVVLDTSPSVANGQDDGQFLIIQGTNDTNTVTFADNTNIQLSGGVSMTLGKGDTLTLAWDSGDSDWYEVSRSSN